MHACSARLNTLVQVCQVSNCLDTFDRSYYPQLISFEQHATLFVDSRLVKRNMQCGTQNLYTVWSNKCDAACRTVITSDQSEATSILS